MIVIDSAPRRDMAFMLTKVVPVLRALIRMGYFSLDVEGAAQIPRQGPVVYVGNHAGWFTLDAFICGLVLADTVGIERTPWWAVQDQLLRAPLLGRLFERVGSFPASWLREPCELPPEMSVFTIYPEGTEGNCKPFWRAYQMRPWHTGFVRLAVKQRALIVPVTAIGGEECLPVAATIRALEPLLGTILPLPLFPLPLPARWRFIFHPPVSVEALGSDDPAELRRQYRALADSVQSTVQRSLDRQTSSHRLGRIGRLLASETSNHRLGRLLRILASELTRR